MHSQTYMNPESKKPNLSDKEEIGTHTQKYPPCSDFEFTSLCVWNIKEKVQISNLHQNIVLQFTGYTVGDFFI